MGRKELSERALWQKTSTEKAFSAEEVLAAVIGSYIELRCPDLEFVEKPKELKGIYGFRLENGKSTNRLHGIEPEFGIRNKLNGKAVYGEVKRQKKNGNAHERIGKYWMPGVMESIRKIANQEDNICPVWVIFTNGITKDENRRQEIMHWFKGIESNVLLWQDFKERDILRNHFVKHIMPMLMDDSIDVPLTK